VSLMTVSRSVAARPAGVAAEAWPSRELRRSAAVYLGLMGYLALVKVAITWLLPAGFRAPAQAEVFAWPAIAFLTAAGLAGVALADRAGLPGLWDARVSTRDRLLLPWVIGIVLGLEAVAVDVATGWAAMAAREIGEPSIHIPFPASALIYPGGAVIVDVVYYLLPIPLLLWVVGRLALRGRWEPQVFWTVGVLAALVEPATQWFGLPGHALLAAGLFASDFVLNLAQVYAFRRWGFLAAVVLRTSFYLVWHVAWGAFAG
jgi:hypothetical protein